MKKVTIEVIITAVLAVVLVALVAARFGGESRAPKQRGPRLTGPPSELVARIERLKARAAQGAPRIKEEQRERALLPWGRDPFFPREK